MRSSAGRFLGQMFTVGAVSLTAWTLRPGPAPAAEPAPPAKPQAAKYKLPPILANGVTGLAVLEFGQGDQWDVLDELYRVANVACSRPISVEQAAAICRCEQLLTLGLSDGDVTDAHLEHLANCRRLTELYLGGTSVSGEFLKKLPSDPRSDNDRADLELLDLSRTLITDEALEELRRLPRLKTLDLSRTELSDAGLRHLQQLAYLESLSLDETDITVGGLKALAPLVTLRNLTLPEFASVDDEPPPDLVDRVVEQLVRLDNLETLSGYFAWTLSDDGLRHVGTLTNLTELDIEGSRFTAAGLKHLQRLSALDTLRFHAARVTDECLAELKNLPQLRALEFYDSNDFTDAGLRDLGAMTNLRSLEIVIHRRPKALARFAPQVAHTGNISDAGLEHLQSLTRLETLVLDGTDVSDRGLKLLAGLTRLETLSVLSPGITAAGVLELRAATRLRRLFVPDWKDSKAKLLEAFPHLRADPGRRGTL